jgi:hypothetical protein
VEGWGGRLCFGPVGEGEEEEEREEREEKKKPKKAKSSKKTLEGEHNNSSAKNGVLPTLPILPAPSSSHPTTFFAARRFVDDSLLTLNADVVRCFSHDHKRDYWGWVVVRRRGMSF